MILKIFVVPSYYLETNSSGFKFFFFFLSLLRGGIQTFNGSIWKQFQSNTICPFVQTEHFRCNLLHHQCPVAYKKFRSFQKVANALLIQVCFVITPPSPLPFFLFIRLSLKCLTKSTLSYMTNNSGFVRMKKIFSFEKVQITIFSSSLQNIRH